MYFTQANKVPSMHNDWTGLRTTSLHHYLLLRHQLRHGVLSHLNFFSTQQQAKRIHFNRISLINYECGVEFMLNN